MTTSAERQRAYRQRQAAKGLVPVNGLVPSHLEAQVLDLLRVLRDNPHLELASLRDSVSGKYVRL